MTRRSMMLLLSQKRNSHRMTLTERQIHELHHWFCERTRLYTKLIFSQRLWYDMLRAYGHDCARLRADVDVIVRYLKREISRGKRNMGALKLINFLQPDNFDSDLALARLAFTPGWVKKELKG